MAGGVNHDKVVVEVFLLDEFMYFFTIGEGVLKVEISGNDGLDKSADEDKVDKAKGDFFIDRFLKGIGLLKIGEQRGSFHPVDPKRDKKEHEDKSVLSKARFFAEEEEEKEE